MRSVPWVTGALCLAAFTLMLAALGRALRGDWGRRVLLPRDRN